MIKSDEKSSSSEGQFSGGIKTHQNPIKTSPNFIRSTSKLMLNFINLMNLQFSGHRTRERAMPEEEIDGLARKETTAVVSAVLGTLVRNHAIQSNSQATRQPGKQAAKQPSRQRQKGSQGSSQAGRCQAAMRRCSRNQSARQRKLGQVVKQPASIIQANRRQPTCSMLRPPGNQSVKKQHDPSRG